MKPIPGFEESYLACDTGKIYSIKRDIFLKHQYDRTGYHRVKFLINGKEKWFLVHRLILITYKGLDLNRKFVNHMDGDKNNNNLSNLEWVTASENKKHAFRTGLTSFKDGKSPSCKLTIAQVITIKKELIKNSHYRNIVKLANKYGVTNSSIYNIKLGKTWPNI